MARYSMFLGRKNQYCEYDYPTKCNLHIQCDPYHITSGIFHRTRTKNFIISMEIAKILICQSNMDKLAWNWGNQASRLQSIPQRYSQQDSMVLAQNINIGLWNKIESPEISPHTYGHVIIGKGGKNIQQRKDSLFNKQCSENWSTM